MKKVRNTEKTMWMLRNEIARLVPYKDTYVEYKNLVIADGIATGRGDVMTESWLTKSLLFDIEEGQVEYGKALYLKGVYMEVIPKLMQMI